MDEIIKWSGWLLAVGMVIWKIVDVVRNRTIIKFFVGISVREGIINHTVINVGRNPVILNKLELEFPDGYCVPIPQDSGVFYGKLGYMEPKINRLNIHAIKALIQKLVGDGMKCVAPKFVYYVNDKGNKYKVKIPAHIKAELLR